ncbi:MAG: UPF0182 family protein, partial [Thermodesulfobacteriota bacterium]|nr:UPF0182 family protein [Thermodesulfobacteriota bacterium]
MKKRVLIGFGIIAILLLWLGVSIYPEWLWFKNLGFSPVFWTMVLSKFGFGLLIWLLLILIIGVNLWVAKGLNPGSGPQRAFKAADGFGLSGRALHSLLTAFVLILTFIIASNGAYRWDLLLRYLYQQPFGS